MNELILPKELYVRDVLQDGRIVTYCTMRQNVLHCIGMIDSGSNKLEIIFRTFYG